MKLLLVVILVVAAACGMAFSLYTRRTIRELRRTVRMHTREQAALLRYIREVGHVFVSEKEIDLDLMLKQVAFFARKITKAEAACVHLRDDADGQFHARALVGIMPPLTSEPDRELDRRIELEQDAWSSVVRTPVNLDDGVLGWVQQHRVALMIADGREDERLAIYASPVLQVRDMIVAPMRFQEQVVGALTVTNRDGGEPFRDRELLQALADQAALSVHFCGLSEDLHQKQVMDYDLEIARQIQRSLLPEDIPQIPGVQLAAMNHPARQVGGDYYDFIRLDDDHLGIAIADVSGKGVAGALMMSICRSVLRAQAKGFLSPGQVLRALNQVISLDITEDMFVTMIYMVLNIRTGELQVARAGHEPPIICRRGGEEVEFIDSPGVAIGIGFPEMMDTSLVEGSAQLRPGDILVAYTDGVTEAVNPQGDEWGLERLLDVVRTTGEQGARPVLHEVHKALQKFSSGNPQQDDTTLLVIHMVE